jgi:hypothetical protein
MKGGLMKIKSFVAVLLAGLALVIFSEIYLNNKQQKSIFAESTKQSALHRQFQLDINQAMIETRDMCNQKYYEVVKPPVGLPESSMVVVMGQEMAFHTNPAEYYVVKKSDKLEVWLDTGCCEIPPALHGKVGEKYPPNSLSCRAK